ncbi:hypothetical protein DQ04_19161010, partial [Trypanosoma grayi]|uniref:hypothetical protein n=1 Tax=Trypanosoma grayi TaxID=71804 RepID=UPI0004F438EF
MQSTGSHPLFESAVFRRSVLDGNERTAAEGDADRNDGAQRPFLPILQAPSRTAAEEAGGGMQPLGAAARRRDEWRMYPTVPYYPAVPALQLTINVAGPEENVTDDLNGADLLKKLPALQALLQDAVAKNGDIFYLSAMQASRNPLLYPLSATTAGKAAASLSSAELDYWRYVQALHDGFRRFVELRDACCRASSAEVCTHHVFFVRIADHPRLKDIVALLAIEKARLCLCLCASSRVTQQYFTQHAQDVGVELEWVLGSALVSEPAGLAMTDVNPVFALWDVFVNLPLHTAPQETGNAVALAALSPEGAGG